MSKKILVVDDDPVQLKQIRDLLGSLNVDLILATNGQQGVDKALKELPDLILMDVVMPEVDVLLRVVKLLLRRKPKIFR